MIKIIRYNETVDIPMLLAQDMATEKSIENAVDAILADVKQNGDAALLAYTQKFDGVNISTMAVSEAEVEEALAQIDPYFIDTLEQAKANITRFHKEQRKQNFYITNEGVMLGQQVRPIEKAGVYVPGGTASYPSTVLMDVIPAKIAGVRQIVMVTPPAKDGKIAPAILAAARVAGVDTIYKVGGAQAIAALAYGTQTIPKVDKIVGPGNIFVATAKKKVFGAVDIDMIAGPTDVFVVADESADPRVVAADMLSQAEHDKLSSACMATTSSTFAEQVAEEIEKQLKALPRKEIAQASIENKGFIFVVKSIEEAIEVANIVAPEHLEISVDDPFAYLDSVQNAGSVFLGHNTPEALGDYFAGPNHTLPTNSTARFSSPLGVDDFVKRTSFIHYSREALEKVKDRVADFAEREGLSGHARSVTIRFEEEKL